MQFAYTVCAEVVSVILHSIMLTPPHPSVNATSLHILRLALKIIIYEDHHTYITTVTQELHTHDWTSTSWVPGVVQKVRYKTQWQHYTHNPYRAPNFIRTALSQMLLCQQLKKFTSSRVNAFTSLGQFQELGRYNHQHLSCN